MPIKVISTIKPVNAGQFPVIEDTDIHGGYQVRATTLDRDSIPDSARKEGMLIFVQADSKFYTLTGGIDNANWIEKNFGGGILAGDVTGPAGSNIVTKVDGVQVGSHSSATSGSSLAFHSAIDSTIFLAPQAMTTDGTTVWSGNFNFKKIDKTNIATKATTSIDLTSFMTGSGNIFARKVVIDTTLSPHVFIATMDANSLLILDATTDAVIGIGDTNGNRARSLTLDNLGNVWIGTHSGNSTVQRFVIADVIAGFPTPVLAASEVSIASDAEEITFDGTHIWTGTSNGDLDKIDPTGSGTNLGTFSTGGWIADVVAAFGAIWINDQGNSNVAKFNPTTFTSGPVDTVAITGGIYQQEMIASNGFLWLPDNQNSGSGTLIQVGVNPLVQVNTFPPPGTENRLSEVAVDPSLNQIYIAVQQDSSSDDNLGFRTFDTSGNSYINSYTRAQAASLLYIPASGAVRPSSPFIGQSFFDVNIDAPVWWDGASWVPADPPTVFGGDVSGASGFQQVVSIRGGAFTNPYNGISPAYSILATMSRWQPTSGAYVDSFILDVTSGGTGSPQPIYQFPAITTGTMDAEVTFLCVDFSNSLNVYRADLIFTAVTSGGSLNTVLQSGNPKNALSNGTLSGVNLSATQVGNSVWIMGTFPFGSNIQMTGYFKLQWRTP